MSRIINPESAGKDRARLSKSIVLAIRELARQTEPGAEARDLAAFITLALQAIHEGIDASVSAWEKRGYWVKADRFRMDWNWAGEHGRKFEAALRAEDWAAIAALAGQTAQRLSKVQIAPNHRLGKPWAGAYDRLLAVSS
jgi:hypothetical protein